jgi:hypothetical protein
VCHTSDECNKNPKNNGVSRYYYSGDSAVNTKKQIKAAHIAATAVAVAEQEDDMSDDDPDVY